MSIFETVVVEARLRGLPIGIMFATIEYLVPVVAGFVMAWPKIFVFVVAVAVVVTEPLVVMSVARAGWIVVAGGKGRWGITCVVRVASCTVAAALASAYACRWARVACGGQGWA